jgi:hypothetical protein
VKKIYSTLFAVSCLVLTSHNTFAQTARARIADTPIRAEANLTSATLATLHEGDSVDVIDAQGAWYRVLVPGLQSKPQVGYVLARLVEVVSGDANPSTTTTTQASQLTRPVAQGPQIPPTAAQLQEQQQRSKAAERQLALKARVETLQAEVDALQNAQSRGHVDTVETATPSVSPVARSAAAATANARNASIARRPTLFITPTDDNFEAYLSAAMIKKEVPVTVVTNQDGAVLVLKASAVTIEKQSTGSKFARCMFAYCTGIEDRGATTVQILKDDQVEWSYSANKGRGQKNRQSLAEAIAKHLKDEYFSAR